MIRKIIQPRKPLINYDLIPKLKYNKFYIMSYYRWDLGTTYYVRERKGEDNPNSDWGYVSDYTKAKPFSGFWAKQFKNDKIYCGDQPLFLEVENPCTP